MKCKNVHGHMDKITNDEKVLLLETSQQQTSVKQNLNGIQAKTCPCRNVRPSKAAEAIVQISALGRSSVSQMLALPFGSASLIANKQDTESMPYHTAGNAGSQTVLFHLTAGSSIDAQQVLSFSGSAKINQTGDRRLQ